MEVVQVQVEWWRRALLVVAAALGGLVALAGVHEPGAVVVVPLSLVGALVPLAPLLVEGRRDFTACCAGIGAAVLLVALPPAGLGLLAHVPAGLVLVLVGAAGVEPAFGIAALVVALPAAGGFGAAALGALVAPLWP